jgi:putative zinc finger protein
MSCENVQEQISALIDRRMQIEERAKVLAHLELCTECNNHFAYLQGMRSALRQIADPPMPAQLQEKLRVMASYERVRQLSRATFGARGLRWTSRLHLVFENMMRPAALPFGGGILSAALAFCLLVSNLSFAHHFGEGPSTQIFNMPDGVVVGAIGDPPRIEPADAVMTDYQTVLELTVDNYGRVTDYQLTRGVLTPDLKELIMFSNFTPATFFGRRTTAKVKIFYGKISSGPGMRS